MERRTLVKGTAWAVPVILTSAPLAAFAASTCTPTLDVLPGSYKCCSGGSSKTMYLVLRVSDGNGCGLQYASNVCLKDVRLANGQPISQVVGKGQCVKVGESIRVNLLGVSSCSVNLLVDLSVDGNTVSVEVKSSNIPGGTAAQCG
jgi:hypothetical protein